MNPSKLYFYSKYFELTKHLCPDLEKGSRDVNFYQRMKPLSLMGGLTSTLIACLLSALQADAQCLSSPNGMWPPFAFSIPCNGQVQTVTENAWSDEYALINVEEGVEYTFAVPEGPAQYITVSTEDTDGIINHGMGSLSFIAPHTGAVRFYSHLDADCNGLQGPQPVSTKTVLCGALDCPDLGLNIGDACDDGNPATINDTVGESCTCVGEIQTQASSCFEPIHITSLPYIVSDHTEYYDNAYFPIHLPGGPVMYPEISNGLALGTFLTGNDVVYSYTAPIEQLLYIDLGEVGPWTALWVFSGCPFQSILAIDTDFEPGSRSIQGLPLSAEESIYIVVSTWDPPQSTAFELKVKDEPFDCMEIDANVGDTCNDGNPETVGDIIHENCQCEGFVVDCPDLAGNIGEPCDDGNPLTMGSLISDSCECIGGVEIDFEGCTEGEPLGLRIPECGGDASIIIGAYANQYTLIQVEAGINYHFSLSEPHYFVTISNNSATEVHAYGMGAATWTAEVDGLVRFYSHAGADCQAISGSPTLHTRIVQAGPCLHDCPDLQANVGDPCPLPEFDGIAATVGMDCQCYEACKSLGGTLSASGSTALCIGLGQPVYFENAQLEGALGDNSIWVITPPGTNYTVLAQDTSGPNFDLDAFLPGNYRLWHLSYENDVDIQTVLQAPATSTGCWDASNPLSLRLSKSSNAGSISTNSILSVCGGEGTPKYVLAQVNGNSSAAGHRWALTDSEDNLLDWRESNSNFNLDLLEEGEYRIYFVNWPAGFGPEPPPSNLVELDQCLGISNPIDVTVLDCTHGVQLSSQPNPSAGLSWVTFEVDRLQRVRLEVYDLSGRLIETLYTGEAVEGHHYSLLFDGSKLPNGVYVYRLHSASEVLIDKFMIAR